jgi:hypothetical protein
MRRPRTFAEMLDAALAAPVEPGLRGGSLTMPADDPYPAVYFRALRSLGVDLQTIQRPAPPSARPAVTPPHRTSATRLLTAAQRDALNAMNELGAGLTPEFTTADLRRAFRSLARRCHPDARFDAGPAERARLTRVFAAMQDAYRCLLNVPRTSGAR